MVKSDYPRFVQILTGVLDVYSKPKSDVAMALWWKALERYDLKAVEAALSEHIMTNRFCPTPADVGDFLRSQDGRLTADEAWAMVPRSESASSPMTDEIAAGLRSAGPLLANGDQVAARRAFIDSYNAAVATARREGKPMRVWFSWGWDPNGRASAVNEAVERGLITHERAAAFAGQLPAPEQIAPAIANAMGDIKRIK